MAKSTYTRHCSYCNNLFITQDRYKQFCNLSCSTANKNKLFRERKLQNYPLNPTRCLQCNTVILYHKKSNKFCTRSCSATYTNARKDYTKIKTGPKKGHVPINYLPKTKVKQCIICGKYHPKGGKTCSNDCKSQLLSKHLKGKTGGNRDANIEYHDSLGNHCYLDSSWELQLANSLDKHNIRWIRPGKFILSDDRSYTPDFYLPDYKVYLDPKALRADYYRNSKLKVQQFERETGYKCLIITKEKFLHWYHVQSMLLLGLHWS